VEKIGIIGIGAWGTALGEHLAQGSASVLGWVRSESQVQRLLESRTNPPYFNSILGKRWSFTSDLGEVLRQDLVICALPSKFVQGLGLESFEDRPPVLVSATKGIIADEFTPCRYFQNIFPQTNVAVVSGPSFALDLVKGAPISVVCASEDSVTALQVAQLLTRGRLRAYVSDDVVGVEWGGILKNVIAIAAGISDGLKLGDSARAALITRGLHEITNFAVSRGARAETLAGLAGLGDLLMTATCDQSRNRTFGTLLGEGVSRGDIERRGLTVEGVRTLELVAQLNPGVDMPIFDSLTKVLAGEWTPMEAVKSLIERPIRTEFKSSVITEG
jgi:glycerol-3-phosphate dehydrogenase (NAD(P)+)